MLWCFFRCPSRYLFDEDTLRCHLTHWFFYLYIRPERSLWLGINVVFVKVYLLSLQMFCCFFRCPSRYLFDEDTLRCQRESRVNCRKFTFNSSQFAKDNVLVVLEQFLEPFFNTPLSYRAAQTMYPQGWRLFQSVIFLPEKISLWCEKKIHRTTHWLRLKYYTPKMWGHK